MKVVQNRNQEDDESTRRVQAEHDSFFGGTIQGNSCQPPEKERWKRLEDADGGHGARTVRQLVDKPEEGDPIQIFPDLGDQLAAEKQSEVLFSDQRERFIHEVFPFKELFRVCLFPSILEQVSCWGE